MRTRTTTVVISLFIGALGATGCASSSNGGRAQYASPDQAVSSLVTALRVGDQEELKEILGPDADTILFSGDEVADRQSIRKFLDAYERRHGLDRVSDDTLALTVGEDRWPLPIPLVRQDGGWVFATERGVDEMISRRIGENELDAVQVSLAIADAQRDYAETDPDGNGLPDYAQKFLSDPGQKNGLYWQQRQGEPPSPLGPLIVQATTEGYERSASGEPTPYHGYYYRVLTAQGPNASGGARDYRVGDALLGGFGVVAWPAEVGNSGLMTFIVNQDGAVYQRYLGPDTDEIARAMTTFDPGPGWTKLQD